MKPEFMKMPVQEREDKLMPEILLSLRNLGGFGSRDEVIKDLKEASESIPEDYIDYERKSAKTGNWYKPFRYQFNFAIRHLNLANFISIPSKGNLELTEKGRALDFSLFNSKEMVRKYSQPIMDSESKKKIVKKKEDSETLTIEKTIEEAPEDESWEIEILTALKNMSPRKFEIFARRLVKAMGVEIDKTMGVSYVSDGGIDGFGYITSDDFRTTRVAIQAKRWEGKVSAPEIDKFRGVMDKFNAEFGIFITTSDYTREAIKTSRIGTRVITLINGESIIDLVAQYELYVTPVTTYKLDDFYFEEE